MDINASLIVQMLVFVVFIGLTMKFIWPPLTKALEARRKNIADGLAAAEEGRKELELAEIKSKEQLTEAKTQAAHIIEQANQRANHIVEEAKNKAREEGAHLIQLAKNEIEQEYNAAKTELLKQISTIAVAGAQKILQREVDKASNDRLVDELVSEI
ncbi:F0F1 ATP synthase subunit B [Coxiella burnetii]|uniref:ATP synthase subunit b n=5 Tax=Coxiella burnetii TaxID=777 RepID=ATPF_COXBU|nr:F0F1 ATP synthase subunit B [Coxiella burnetii]NP_820917.1 ATP synthase subunit B [Coxiella burnetii RSA 493]A9KBG1.1 RecName: Full=ATP synthase subunit b; AltName: Full=ATP synthase F(0) sector subunit b; AltName: Full=ATPase subunit I; AltName: Full=F-type ATPase subunit b; Short=F-ATPase subunit b [Coxiella burnetii Dugway 5J108-111]A9NBC6.1 RecName: Full=ATP synthase subunit b; AltName: Full=ATP synthase F(0) sector subunit b; AltName: Full=ATPase subunit I; AltName: Full=F-type ATPase su